MTNLPDFIRLLDKKDKTKDYYEKFMYKDLIVSTLNN